MHGYVVSCPTKSVISSGQSLEILVRVLSTGWMGVRGWGRPADRKKFGKLTYQSTLESEFQSQLVVQKHNVILVVGVL